MEYDKEDGASSGEVGDVSDTFDEGRSKPELNFTFDKKWAIDVPWYKQVIVGTKSKVIVFGLKVYFGSIKWMLEKRFSECFRLNTTLKKTFDNLPPFPSKRPKVLIDTKFLQQRQTDLQAYFQGLDEKVFDTDELRNFLCAFTNLAKEDHMIRPLATQLEPVIDGKIFCTKSTYKYYNIDMPLSMTVIKLKQGDLLLYSTTKLEDATLFELNQLGEVKYIISPNKLHHHYLEDYQKAFPHAKFYLAPGTKEKYPNLKADHVLTDQPEPEWSEELDQILTCESNTFFREVILYHKESKTLIVGDYIELFPPGFWNVTGAQSIPAKSLSIWLDALDKPTCSPEHSTYSTDPESFRSTRDRILEWPFERLIMCHGKVINDKDQAREAVQSATDLVIAKAKERWGVTNSVISFMAKMK